MLLLAHLAKLQGLKGEFLLHEVMDEPEKLESLPDLFLVPPHLELDAHQTPPPEAIRVKIRSFRFHQDRACVAFEGFADRTQAEPYKGYALWALESQLSLEDGESYRHDWIGCEVYVKGERVGEIFRLDPTPMGYDMVQMKDLRPGRTGLRSIPYIKAWFSLDLPNRRVHLDPPEGLLDLDRIAD